MDEVRDHVGSDAERIASLEATVDELRALVERQGAVLAALVPPAVGHTSGELASAATGGRDEGVEGDEASTDRALSRRRLLLGGGATAAATAAALVASSEPAAANTQGQSWTLGGSNTATALTTLSAGIANSPALKVTNTSTVGSGIVAQAGTSAGLAATGAVLGDSQARNGVVGLSSAKYGVLGRNGVYSGSIPDAAGGVMGESDTDVGVLGASNTGTAVIGLSGGSYGVLGVGDDYVGTAGMSDNGIGVYGQSDKSAGVRGDASKGPGGIFGSPYAQLALASVGERLVPTSDTVHHAVGEIVLDLNADVWLCTVAGTPGTWRKLGGPATAGAFHVNPTPVRVYDSRAGTAPSTLPKTPLGANEQRTVSLANSSGAPKGATAAMVTCLLVNTSTGNGNFTMWKAGTAKPASNSLVWGGSTARFTATAVSALDVNAKVLVSSSLQTDIVLDVVGYYL